MTRLLGPVASTPAAEAQQYLSLALGEEWFALPIEHVREIIECSGLTPIPLMPSFLRGVINLRGAVVPVIDLAVRFGRERTLIGKRSCIVIVEVAQADSVQSLGIIVDTVSAVLAVQPDQVQARPAFGARLRADFIAGILEHQQQFMVVLDVTQVLSLHELAALVATSA